MTLLFYVILRSEATENLIKLDMHEKQMVVYIMTNAYNSVLYTGVTSNIAKRLYEHKNKLIPGFTARYNITKLVFYEVASEPLVAIEREKEIKGWTRRKKDKLIESLNPYWKDLSDEILR